MEGVLAVKYPRAPVPATPGKTPNLFSSSPTPKRAFKVLSPQSSPQPQKPFSLSQAASPSKYPASPLSTPSRVVHYSSVAGSSTNTNASSTSTMMFHSTPSPVTAYRGALDESFLRRVPPTEPEEAG
ncbi:hypothetical protein H0H92_010205 [Tricholoma furcatifolium]|nr:hypothetical protein H0H92_010205 [Tricholoma furcatifolium]